MERLQSTQSGGIPHNASGLQLWQGGGFAVVSKSHLPAVVPTRTKPQSLAYVEKPLSQRWMADARCERLGWVMVPYDATENLTHAIADPFDELAHAMASEGFFEFAHPDLLKGLNDLEKFLVEDLCSLANSWRKTRITGWEKSRTVVVTNEAAVIRVDEVMTDLFGKLGEQIKDYNLLDDRDRNDARIFFALQRLQEYVIRKVLKVVRGWK
jgi:hypothetical protein